MVILTRCRHGRPSTKEVQDSVEEYELFSRSLRRLCACETNIVQQVFRQSLISCHMLIKSRLRCENKNLPHVRHALWRAKSFDNPVLFLAVERRAISMIKFGTRMTLHVTLE